MSEDHSKELSIAIKAATEAGKYLSINKNELNKLSSSDKRDTKLQADIASENLIKEIINLKLYNSWSLKDLGEGSSL